MALHTQLPIYKVAYDLLSVATDYVQNMPRAFKAAIGGRVRDLCVDLVLLIFKANCAKNKVPLLDALLEKLEELNLVLTKDFQGAYPAIQVLNTPPIAANTAPDSRGFFSSVAHLRPGSGQRYNTLERGESCRPSIGGVQVPGFPLNRGKLEQTDRRLIMAAHSRRACSADDLTIRRALHILHSRFVNRTLVLEYPKTASDYLRMLLAGKDREEFWALWLNNNNALIASEMLAWGSIASCSVPMREVMRSALRNNAAAVIFAHNHPSGISEPSAADYRLTEALRQTLRLIDVRVLDHYVVTARETVSAALQDSAPRRQAGRRK